MSGVKVTRIGTGGDPLAGGLSSTGTVSGTDIDWPTSAGDVVAALDDLVDVNAPSPADGDVLTWDIGASEWVPAAGGGAVATDAIWDAKGDLAVGSGANTAARLAVGSNTYVLTADSTAALGVKWAASSNAGGTITTKDEGTSLSTSVTTLDFVGSGVTASGAGATTTITIPGGGGGGLDLLEQHTASASATLDFTSFSSTYDEYLFEGVGLVPATNASGLRAVCGSGAGPTYDTGNNYYWALSAYGSSGTATTLATGAPNGYVGIATAISNNAGYGLCSFTLRVTGVPSTADAKYVYGTTMYHNGTEFLSGTFGGGWISYSTPLTALRFKMSSGNITSGTIRMYGLAK